MSTTTPPDVPAPDRPKRNRGGAPKGNVNAALDPQFQRRMREAQRLAARGRRKRHRDHLAAARAAIAEAGLQGSLLGERVAVRLAQIETEVVEMQRVIDRSGRTRRDLSLTPPYERMLSLIREDRVELRALIDKLGEAAEAQGARMPATLEEARERIAAIAGRWPAALEFRIASADGTPFDLGDGLHPPASPLQADPAAAMPPAIPPPLEAPQAAGASTPPLHPVDLFEAKQAAARARARAETLRAWVSGEDV